MFWMFHLRMSPLLGTYLAAKFSNRTAKFSLSFPPETQSFLHSLSVPDIISLLPAGQELVSSSEEVYCAPGL